MEKCHIHFRNNTVDNSAKEAKYAGRVSKCSCSDDILFMWTSYNVMVFILPYTSPRGWRNFNYAVVKIRSTTKSNQSQFVKGKGFLI